MMRTTRGIAVLALVVVVRGAMGQVLAPVDGEILIPCISPLKIEKTLYDYASIGQLDRRGYHAYVVQVNPSELEVFVERNVAADKLWMQGSMRKNPFYGEIVDWVLASSLAAPTRAALGAVVDFEALKDETDLYLKAIFKTDSDGNTLREATLWIIRPKLNQVILLNLIQ